MSCFKTWRAGLLSAPKLMCAIPRELRHQLLTATDMQPCLLAQFVRHQFGVFSNAARPRGNRHVRSNSGSTSSRSPLNFACLSVPVHSRHHSHRANTRRHFLVCCICHLTQQSRDIVWMPVSRSRKSDFNGVAFHDVIVNVVVLFAKFWVGNSNILGIAGKSPFGASTLTLIP